MNTRPESEEKQFDRLDLAILRLLLGYRDTVIVQVNLEEIPAPR